MQTQVWSTAKQTWQNGVNCAAADGVTQAPMVAFICAYLLILSRV